MQSGMGRAQYLRTLQIFLSLPSDDKVGVQLDTLILVQITFCILPLNALLVPVSLGPLPAWETILL